MLRISIAAALAAVSAPAAAEDWRITALTGDPGDGTLFLVDAASVERRDGDVSFTLLMLYQRPFEGVDRVLNRMDARCDGFSFTIPHARFYGADRFLGDHRAPDERIQAAPDSAFEDSIEAACARQWGSGTIAAPRDAADAIFRSSDPAEAARSM